MDSISRRSFLKKSGLAVVSTALLPRSAISNTEKRPNIVLILADDMGFSDIGCYGGEIETPNLDALSGDGVRFSQFYNGARCCPTRASLLTGLYAHQTGIGHMTDSSGGAEGYRGDLNNHCLTIAQVLKSAGYSTYMAGKWHLTPYIKPGQPQHNWPCQRGFDKFYGTIIGANSFFSPTTLALNNSLLPPPRDDYYYTDRLSDLAVQNIRDHKHAGEKNKPFFLYLSYTAPHWPLHALPEDIARYEGKYRGGWDALRTARHEELKGMKVLDEKWPVSPRDKGAPAWGEIRESDWEDLRMAVYAAQVDRMDQGVGHVLGALQDSGIEENTLVLFLSDNGGCAEFLAEETGRPEPFRYSIPTADGRPMRVGNTPSIRPGPDDTFQSYDLPWANASNAPFRLFKHWVHEGGISTPMIAQWPAAIHHGRIEHAVCHVIDLMATCLDAAGLPYPDGHGDRPITPSEGESLLPALASPDWQRQLPVYWEHEGNSAVRDGEWKLVRKHPGTWELYNMDDDRTELNDLAGRNRPDRDRLIRLYDAWAARCEVRPWPLV